MLLFLACQALPFRAAEDHHAIQVEHAKQQIAAAGLPFPSRRAGDINRTLAKLDAFKKELLAGGDAQQKPTSKGEVRPLHDAHHHHISNRDLQTNFLKIGRLVRRVVPTHILRIPDTLTRLADELRDLSAEVAARVSEGFTEYTSAAIQAVSEAQSIARASLSGAVATALSSAIDPLEGFYDDVANAVQEGAGWARNSAGIAIDWTETTAAQAGAAIAEVAEYTHNLLKVKAWHRVAFPGVTLTCTKEIKPKQRDSPTLEMTGGVKVKRSSHFRIRREYFIQITKLELFVDAEMSFTLTFPSSSSQMSYSKAMSSKVSGGVVMVGPIPIPWSIDANLEMEIEGQSSNSFTIKVVVPMKVKLCIDAPPLNSFDQYKLAALYAYESARSGGPQIPSLITQWTNGCNKASVGKPSISFEQGAPTSGVSLSMAFGAELNLVEWYTVATQVKVETLLLPSMALNLGCPCINIAIEGSAGIGAFIRDALSGRLGSFCDDLDFGLDVDKYLCAIPYICGITIWDRTMDMCNSRTCNPSLSMLGSRALNDTKSSALMEPESEPLAGNKQFNSLIAFSDVQDGNILDGINSSGDGQGCAGTSYGCSEYFTDVGQGACSAVAGPHPYRGLFPGRDESDVQRYCVENDFCSGYEVSESGSFSILCKQKKGLCMDSEDGIFSTGRIADTVPPDGAPFDCSIWNNVSWTSLQSMVLNDVNGLPYGDERFSMTSLYSPSSNATIDLVMACNGLMEAYASGTGVFCTESADGSKLYIGEGSTLSTVVDNDGLHGMKKKCGTFDVVKGKIYNVVFNYFSAGSPVNGYTVTSVMPGVLPATYFPKIVKEAKYTGCFRNSASWRVTGHLGKKTSFGECFALAEAAGVLEFGLENSDGCLLGSVGEDKFRQLLEHKIQDSACESNTASNFRTMGGYRLGGYYAVAMYRRVINSGCYATPSNGIESTTVTIGQSSTGITTITVPPTTTLATECPRIVNYTNWANGVVAYVGGNGANWCDGATVGLSEAQCSTYAQSKASSMQTKDSNNDPKGCFFDAATDSYFFNTHPTGSTRMGTRPICNNGNTYAISSTGRTITARRLDSTDSWALDLQFSCSELASDMNDVKCARRALTKNRALFSLENANLCRTYDTIPSEFGSPVSDSQCESKINNGKRQGGLQHQALYHMKPADPFYFELTDDYASRYFEGRSLALFAESARNWVSSTQNALIVGQHTGSASDFQASWTDDVFEVVSVSNGLVGLYSAHQDRWIQMHSDGTIRMCCGGHQSIQSSWTWETFEIVNNFTSTAGANTIALYSPTHNRWVQMSGFNSVSDLASVSAIKMSKFGENIAVTGCSNSACALSLSSEDNPETTWSLVPQSNGQYRLRGYSSMYLAVKDCWNGGACQLGLTSDATSDETLWSLYKKSNGQYEVHGYSGRYLALLDCWTGKCRPGLRATPNSEAEIALLARTMTSGVTDNIASASGMHFQAHFLTNPYRFKTYAADTSIQGSYIFAGEVASEHWLASQETVEAHCDSKWLTSRILGESVALFGASAHHWVSSTQNALIVGQHTGSASDFQASWTDDVFEVVSVSNGLVGLYSAHQDRWIQMHSDGTIRMCCGGHQSIQSSWTWETFEIVNNFTSTAGANTIALYSPTHNRWVQMSGFNSVSDLASVSTIKMSKFGENIAVTGCSNSACALSLSSEDNPETTWSLVPQSNGQYRLRGYSSMYLAVKDCWNGGACQLGLTSDATSDETLWSLYKKSNGQYEVHGYSGRYLALLDCWTGKCRPGLSATPNSEAEIALLARTMTSGVTDNIASASGMHFHVRVVQLGQAVDSAAMIDLPLESLGVISLLVIGMSWPSVRNGDQNCEGFTELIQEVSESFTVKLEFNGFFVAVADCWTGTCVISAKSEAISLENVWSIVSQSNGQYRLRGYSSMYLAVKDCWNGGACKLGLTSDATSEETLWSLYKKSNGQYEVHGYQGRYLALLDCWNGGACRLGLSITSSSSETSWNLREASDTPVKLYRFSGCAGYSWNPNGYSYVYSTITGAYDLGIDSRIKYLGCYYNSKRQFSGNILDASACASSAKQQAKSMFTLGKDFGCSAHSNVPFLDSQKVADSNCQSVSSTSAQITDLASVNKLRIQGSNGMHLAVKDCWTGNCLLGLSLSSTSEEIEWTLVSLSNGQYKLKGYLSKYLCVKDCWTGTCSLGLNDESQSSNEETSWSLFQQVDGQYELRGYAQMYLTLNDCSNGACSPGLETSGGSETKWKFYEPPDLMVAMYAVDRGWSSFRNNLLGVAFTQAPSDAEAICKSRGKCRGYSWDGMSMQAMFYDNPDTSGGDFDPASSSWQAHQRVESEYISARSCMRKDYNFWEISSSNSIQMWDPNRRDKGWHFYNPASGHFLSAPLGQISATQNAFETSIEVIGGGHAYIGLQNGLYLRDSNGYSGLTIYHSGHYVSVVDCWSGTCRLSTTTSFREVESLWTLVLQSNGQYLIKGYVSQYLSVVDCWKNSCRLGLTDGSNNDEASWTIHVDNGKYVLQGLNGMYLAMHDCWDNNNCVLALSSTRSGENDMEVKSDSISVSATTENVAESIWKLEFSSDNTRVCLKNKASGLYLAEVSGAYHVTNSGCGSASTLFTAFWKGEQQFSLYSALHVKNPATEPFISKYHYQVNA